MSKLNGHFSFMRNHRYKKYCEKYKQLLLCCNIIIKILSSKYITKGASFCYMQARMRVREAFLKIEKSALILEKVPGCVYLCLNFPFKM